MFFYGEKIAKTDQPIYVDWAKIWPTQPNKPSSRIHLPSFVVAFAIVVEYGNLVLCNWFRSGDCGPCLTTGLYLRLQINKLVCEAH
jgi:hypothetical protein